MNVTGFALLPFHSIPLGESPPPAPRACFGRGELVEEVVGFAVKLKPVALIGAGGIGKTSIALTVLHHNRIKERFGENRRFIRCDQFPASRAHFLTRLSEVVGAGVKNPKDLTPLRPHLFSKEVFIVLDNAESILDPKGESAEEINSVVEELCQFETMCLCITSRIATVPPYCRRPEIPTLSMVAACDIFYGIYGVGSGRSSTINALLERLDFHPLSITLLATTASHNSWDYNRLAKEWDTQRAPALQTEYNKSLAATIELSLTSPTFRSLGADARDLLSVAAFFPQGIDEKNLDWLFPTIANRRDLFDKFCLLSLTHRNNGFITMLALIQDYLVPRDPRSSPLLCTTRNRYFSRLLVSVDPEKPGYEDARWIVSEDVNVEHLLDVFISIQPNAGGIWDVCFRFMQHLYWHKPRQTMLSSKIEALPDDHPHKPRCLFELSRLFGQIGHRAEQKRLLTLTLELERRSGDEFWVAETLRSLADANRVLGLHEEGIRRVKEALEIQAQIGDAEGQTRGLNQLAWLLFEDGQLDAAEYTASRAIDLITEKGQEYLVCKLHRILGYIHQSNGAKDKAIHHFKTVLGIATAFRNWDHTLFWAHYDLANLSNAEGELEVASAYIERAKSHAVNDAYQLGSAMQIQAQVWYRQLRLEDAKLEALYAFEIYDKLGAAEDARACGHLLQTIEQKIEERSASLQGELLRKFYTLRLLTSNLQREPRASATWQPLPGALAKDLGDSPFLNAASFTFFLLIGFFIALALRL